MPPQDVYVSQQPGRWRCVNGDGSETTPAQLHAYMSGLPMPTSTPQCCRTLSLGGEIMAGNALGGPVIEARTPQDCLALGIHGASAGPTQSLLNLMTCTNNSTGANKWKDTSSWNQLCSHFQSTVLFGWDHFLDKMHNKLMRCFTDFDIESAFKNRSHRFLKIQCKHCQSWTMVNWNCDTKGADACELVVTPLAEFLLLQEAASPSANNTV